MTKASHALPVRQDERAARYCQAALRRAVDEVRSAPGDSGAGNITLNNAAHGVAQLICTGGITEDEIRGAMAEAALSVGLATSEVRSTLKSAIRSGLAKPRFPDFGRPANRAPAPTHPNPRHRPPENRPGMNVEAILAKAAPASDAHGYIVRKGGAPDGLYITPELRNAFRDHDVTGWLMVPAFDLDGTLQTAQFFPGQPGMPKLSAPGRAIAGAVFVVGSPDGRLTDDIIQGGKVTLVEGLATGWSAFQVSAVPAVVCFGKGNLATIAKALRARHPALHITIAPDVGGEQKAEEIVRMIGAPAGWVEMPEGWEQNSDLNDLAAGEDGHTLVRKVLEDVKQPTPATPTKFKLSRVSEICAQAHPDWITHDLVPAVGIAIIFGDSGSGKSFVTKDLTIRIARGEPWAGRRTKRARVVYVVLEGSLRTRLEAYKRFHGLTDADLEGFHVIDGIPMDLLEADEAETFISDLRLCLGEYERLVVVIDTLARAMPGGNENTSEDMGRLIAAADRIYRELGALVILVHHSGKDAARGARGWSGLRAAMDLEIEVARDGENRTLSFTKVKDGLDGISHEFKLEVVDIGARRDHDPEADPHERITSCVAVVGEQVTKSAKPARRTAVQTNAFIAALLAQGGKANKIEFRRLLTTGENRVMSQSTFYFVVKELEANSKLESGFTNYILLEGDK